LRNLFGRDANSYLNIIFHDFIVNKIYYDCGIIGAHDKNNNFIGYIAYYEIAENIRDVSYIYIGEEYRGRGYGKDLLNFFVNKNIIENKISYYSYAADEVSEKLVKSCGFISCAKRFEK
jgi:predicted GNAT family acetyltransferase